MEDTAAASVAAAPETAPTAQDGANGVATWVNPAEPARSLILGAGGTGGLEGYGLDGALRQRIADIEATVWVNNPNAGKIWGVELDFSSPLAFIDPNFHVFANYTWIDSEIRDANANFSVDRRFSLQPDYIYSVGFDHLIETEAKEVTEKTIAERNVMRLAAQRSRGRSRSGIRGAAGAADPVSCAVE